MAKTIFEFNSDEEHDVNLVVNRIPMLYALEQLDRLYRDLYNGKIYNSDAIVYIKEDGTVATEEDYKRVQETGAFLSGGKHYVNQDWLEGELDNILSEVRHLLD